MLDHTILVFRVSMPKTMVPKLLGCAGATRKNVGDDDPRARNVIRILVVAENGKQSNQVCQKWWNVKSVVFGASRLTTCVQNGVNDSGLTLTRWSIFEYAEHACICIIIYICLYIYIQYMIVNSYQSYHVIVDRSLRIDVI